MDSSGDRLVWRIQRQLSSTGRPIRVSSRELAILADRVERLRAASDRLGHVALSPQVAKCLATSVLSRVGGECVATEV